MKWIAIIALIAFSGSVSAFDFKGIEVGGPQTVTRAQIEQVLDKAECEEWLEKGWQRCTGSTTVAGWIVDIVEIYLDPNRVATKVSFFFDKKFHQDVVKACVAKFGKPTKKTTVPMGDDMEDMVELEWIGPNGKEVLLSNYGAIDQSYMYFGSRQENEHRKRIYEKAEQDRKKIDL